MPRTSPRKSFTCMKAVTSATAAPANLVPPAPTWNDRRPATPTLQTRMKQRILVVDDEPDALEVIRVNLVHAGFNVITAEDGQEALTKARNAQPDLILLDLMLPEVDGLEVCKILRRDDVTKDIPIIVVTAKATEIDRVLGLELGAGEYVTKPFSPRELVLRVKAMLRRLQNHTDASEQIRVGQLLV